MQRLAMAFSALVPIVLAALWWVERAYQDRFYVRQAGFGTRITAVLLVAFFGFSVAAAWVLRRRPSHRIGRVWGRLLLIGIAIFAADALAGLLLLERPSGRVAPSPTAHHANQPGDYVEGGTRIHVGERGLRGVRSVAAKSPDTYRILTLGDSFTFGVKVGDDETFSARLEQRLRAAGCPPTEVLNGGADSYAPILEYFHLRQLLPLRPDLVVLNFDMSDLVQEQIYRKTSHYDFEGESGIRPQISDGWVDAQARRHLPLTRSVLHLLQRALLRGPFEMANPIYLVEPELLQHTLASDTRDRSAEWDNVFDSLRRIKALTDANGMRLLLVAYPWGHQVHRREWRDGRRRFVGEDPAVSDRSLDTLRAFAARADIDFLDTFPAFRAYQGAELLYGQFDMHWTPRGHEVMAAELERHIGSRYLACR